VIDWCHPAGRVPADITLITPEVLPRQQGALSDYQPAAIAVLGASGWRPRTLRALDALMHSALAPLVIVEEWADSEVIATAVGRIACVTPSVADRAVTAWHDDRIQCGGLHTVRTGEMARAVLAHCAST
jgi:hypothetical protein